MSFGIKIEVWGDFASFNRPEMKVERVSYDVITPSAARGILEAIYWKPEMRWVIDEIRVLRPIRFTHVRRNELSAKISVKGGTGVEVAMKNGSGRLGMDVQDVRQQRAAMILRDVRYGIRAHIEVLNPGSESNPAAKHVEMFKRRAERGQFFHHPYLGTREFPAHFELVQEFSEVPEELVGFRDLGFMLHDIEYEESTAGTVIESHTGKKLLATPRFFRAHVQDGVIEVPRLEDSRA